MLSRRFFSIAVLVLAGCGGGDGPALQPVSGTVTQGGKPLPGVSVTFTPESGPSSAGRTNEAGKFVLLNSSGRAGAVAGKHKVVLTEAAATVSGPVDMTNKATVEAMMKSRGATGKRGAPVAEKKKGGIPEDYTSPTSTPLEFEVKAGKNEFDIPIP